MLQAFLAAFPRDTSAFTRVLRVSLSIRRFWGKRGKMEAKKGENWRRETFLFSPPPPSPIKNLVSPIHLGRPDTQANSGYTVKGAVKVHCTCRHPVDKLDHSWNPRKNFPVLFKLNFPLLQPHRLHSGKYFLKISKSQQVQSLNYYSKKRGKLIDSCMGLFSHDPFFGSFVFTFDFAAKPWYKYRLFSILTWRRDWISI